jgi:hypothetical protein
MVAGSIVDSTGSYAIAYAAAAGLCLVAATLTFATHPPTPIAIEADDENSGQLKAA